jgi:electron transport complex protein RnfC
MGLSTFQRGIHPAYNKDLTSSRPVKRAGLPKTVVIPLLQHAGAPCEPLVKKGDLVSEGQKIGDVKAFVSAPVHASISGKIKEVDLYPHPTGAKALSVVIEGDGAERQWPSSGVDLDSLSPEDIRAAIKEAGIVGMGGAAFPTSVKLMPPKEKAIDTVILNGCECEPFLTADHRIMVEEADKVIWGLRAIMRATGANAGLIGIEENKPDAIEALRRAIGGLSGISVKVLETKYPQGAEKMLIQAAIGRKVPLGKLPLDVGVIVNNVGTSVAVHDAVVLKKPLIERVVTVSGNGVREPQNLRVRLGTSFEEVISQCGGISVEDGLEYEVLNGGPMMGIAQTNLSVPVVKGTSGITVLSAKVIKPKSFEPCIRCGSCVNACPMGLMPYRLGDYGRAYRTPEFKEWAGLACIECGCCSFVCPAKRPLLHWIRLGKLKVREEARAQAKK